MKKENSLVILSLYDGGVSASLLENNKILNIDYEYQREAFKSKFGKYPWEITIEELRKHYPKDTIVVICENGDIII